jgi:hypothetical protein
MVDSNNKIGDFKRISRIALLVGMWTVAAVVQSGASANPLATNAGGNDLRIVVVHSDDQVGIDGLSQTKSCLPQKTTMSEQKPLEGVQSTLLIMKYDSNGKILGVHYGAKNVCEFLQTLPTKAL